MVDLRDSPSAYDGQGGAIIAAALPVCRLGGLLYVTSTDGLALSGRRPEVRGVPPSDLESCRVKHSPGCTETQSESHLSSMFPLSALARGLRRRTHWPISVR